MGSHPQAEPSLVEAACAGDQDALQELWRMHRRWVAAIVLAHRPRAVEVDDLMQDVAVKFVSKMHTLRDPAALRPWLRQIILNVCRGSARGLKPVRRLADPGHNGEAFGHAEPSAMPFGRETPVEDRAERRDAAGRLMAQLLTLPAEYREPLLLRCVQALSYQEISEILGLPVTTIETRLARARRMLREEVGDLSSPR